MIEKIHPVHPHFSIVAPCRFDDALTPTELAAKTQKTVNELVSQVNKNTSTIEDIVGGHTINEINGLIPDEHGALTLEAKDIPYDSEDSVKDAIDALKEGDADSVKTINGKTPVDGELTLHNEDITSEGGVALSDTLTTIEGKADQALHELQGVAETRHFYYVNESVPETVATGSVLIANIRSTHLETGDWLIGSNGYIAEVQSISSLSASVQGNGNHLSFADSSNIMRYYQNNVGTESDDTYNIYAYELNPSTNLKIGDAVVGKNGYIATITRIYSATSSVEITCTGNRISTGSAEGSVRSVNSKDPDEFGDVELSPMDIQWQPDNQSRDEGMGTINTILNFLNDHVNLCFLNGQVPTSSTTVQALNTSFYPVPRYLDYVIGSNGYVGQAISFSGNTIGVVGLGIAITTSEQVTGLASRIATLEAKSVIQTTDIATLLTCSKKNTGDIDYEGEEHEYTTYTLANMCFTANSGSLQLYIDDWDAFQALIPDMPSSIITTIPANLSIQGTPDRNGESYVYNIELVNFSISPDTYRIYRCMATSQDGAEDFHKSDWFELTQE